MNLPGNFVQLFYQQALLTPGRLALACPDYASLTELKIKERYTFQEFAQRVSTVALGMQGKGVQPGDRVVLLAPLSADLFAVVLGLMAMGAVPVLMNPGMGTGHLYRCLELIRPDALVLSPKFRLLRWLLPVLRKVKYVFTLPGKPVAGVLKEFSATYLPDSFSPILLPPGHSALITFTSGSSGLPKGVNRTHEVLMAQCAALKTEFPPLAEQTDMPGFPVLTLYNLSYGISTVLPLVNFRQLTTANPALLLQQIIKFEINTLSGAPAYLRFLIRYCRAKKLQLPQILGLATGGAPIERQLLLDLQEIFPRAAIHLAYGSSEAEPVAAITAAEVLSQQNQPGYWAGKPAQQVQLRILPLRYWPAAEKGQLNWNQVETGPQEIGEVIVTGDHVCKEYISNPAADQAHKLRDEQGQVWHRMGDLGFLDARGFLWLTGRKENLLPGPAGPMGSYPVEILLNLVPGIRRAGVITGRQNDEVVVFAETGLSASDLAMQLRSLLLERFGLRNVSFKVIKQLPVDTRHQSKIDTPKLRDLL